MQERSGAGKALHALDIRAYDATVKKFLSERPVLANIMKGCCEEYKDCDVQEIAEKYIEGTPQVSSVRMERDQTNAAYASEGSRIIGDNTEDSTDTEGTVFYDIRFHALAPNGEGHIRLIINIEAQKDDDPGYPLVKRGIYYCSRLISAQKGVEFKHSEYEKIRKVYSIWICHESKTDRNTMVRYAIRQENMVGDAEDTSADHDLMQVIILRLGDPKVAESGTILHMLNTVFDADTLLSRKMDTLETEYGVAMTEAIERSVTQMCNIGEGIYEKGMEKGMAQGMEKGMAQGMEKGIEKGKAEMLIELVKSGLLSVTDACKRIGMTQAEFEAAMAAE